jgi:hypothetical protein
MLAGKPLERTRCRWENNNMGIEEIGYACVD